MSDEPAATPTLDRRKQVVAGALTIAVLAFVFLKVFPSFADYSDAWSSIQNMSIVSVVLLLAVTVLNIVVYVFPYQASMPGLTFRDGFVVRQTSFMISNVIPAGGAFGVGVQYTMLSGYGYGAASTTTAIGATSVWNLMVTLALPVVAVVLLLFDGDATSAQFIGAVVGIVVVVVMVALFALVLRSEPAAHRIGSWGDSLLNSFDRRFHRRNATVAEPDEDGDGQVTDALLRFRDTLRGVVNERWQLITVTSVGQQLCQFAVLAVAFYGITGNSGGIGPSELFASFALSRLATFIPITPGGLGTVDAAMVALMASYGAQKDDALAATLVWRAASFIPQVVIGVITFLVWRRQSAKRRGGRGARDGSAASVGQPHPPGAT